MGKKEKTKATLTAKAADKPSGLTRKDAGLIRRVIKRQESITRKDIADWKRARQQATSSSEPKQLLLQNLYDEIMLDALMTSQISVLRIGKSQGADFDLRMNGVRDDEQTQKLKDSGLYEDLVELIIEAQFFGHSLIELDFDDFGPIADLIPRKHLSPEVGKFYPDPSGSETIAYRELPEFGKWLVEVYPRKRDLGLLNKAVPYVLIKKFAMSCWSELCEIFGIPPRVMKTNTTDDEMLERAETMMKEIGSAAYFIIDTTENFEFAQGVATNGDVYKNLISTCDQQLSLLNLAAVVGQDTENGNRSKEESSTKLVEAVVKADTRLIESSFNRKFIPALAAIGFLKPGLCLHITKDIDLEKFWKMTHEASQNYDVDPAWIKDTFGIAVLGKKTINIPPPGGEGGGESTEGREPDFFLEAPQAGASDGSDLTAFNEQLIQRVADGESAYWDAELFHYVVDNLLNAVQTGFKPQGGMPTNKVQYDAPDDAYKAAMEQNLFHFSAAKTLAEVQELNQAFRESKNFNEYKSRAQSIASTFNDQWQRTEYRSAVQIAEAASSYRYMKSQERLFPVWRYCTVGDGQVRPEHAALDGLELPSNDPAWGKIYPPNEWNCRCWVEMIMAEEHEGGFDEQRTQIEEFLQSPTWKKAAAQGWGVNRAETAEVFTANQMYIRKFPDHAPALVGKLHYNDWGLDSFGKRLGQATDVFPEFAGKPADWYAANKSFKDFSGKTLELSQKAFETHTAGKYTSSRVPLLNSIPEVLRTPDEVWLNDYKKGFNNLNYIKFYQGKVVNVVCGIENNSLQVNTWFEIEKNPTTKSGKKIAKDKDPRWRYRRGLLVKK